LATIFDRCLYNIAAAQLLIKDYNVSTAFHIFTHNCTGNGTAQTMAFDIVVILLIGFSVTSAVILIPVYAVMYQSLNKSWASITSAVLLLVCFIVLQLMHLEYILNPNNLFNSKIYSSIALITAPLYLLFVLEYIGGKLNISVLWLLHLLPILVNMLIPNQWSLPLGFLVGTGYSAYCLRELHTLKEARTRFKFEQIALAFFGIVTITILLLAVFAQLLNTHYFIVGYSLLISVAFLLVITILLLYPDVAVNLNIALESKYAKSTLEKVDRSSVLAKLDTLMQDEKLSRDESLNLNALAAHSGYNSHQISELINSEFGYGVSQYIRQHRVRDARQMLKDEPDASILSIGLAAGFTSQSTFYAAFNQIVGMTPGNFRKSI